MKCKWICVIILALCVIFGTVYYLTCDYVSVKIDFKSDKEHYENDDTCPLPGIFCEKFHHENLYCGRRDRVVGTMFGGQKMKATDLPWPWLTALLHQENFFCAGSLISQKHVLSAAHCFQHGSPEIAAAEDVKALFGKLDIEAEEINSKSSMVAEIIIHPEWDYKSRSFDADIAIVVLTDQINFSSHVQPVCLPPAGNYEVLGTGFIVGWGKSLESGNNHEQIPSQLEIPAVSATHCYPRFPLLAEASSHRSFCGGFDNQGKAPCTGDSGGGFYFKIPSELSWSVRGIISAAIINENRQCDANKFTIYTNVAMFVDWITKAANETKKVVLKSIEFDCSDESNNDDIITTCTYDYNGLKTRNLQVRPKFAEDSTIANAHEVKILSITFTNFIYFGIGEAFNNLEELHITGSVEFLKKSDFAQLDKLKKLNISGNPIKFLQEDVFYKLPTLEVLDLNDCKIEKLPENVFSKQKLLTKLDVSWNRLRSFDSPVFGNIKNLEWLNFSKNPIGSIAECFFRDLSKLEVLNLSDCRIDALPQHVFIHIKKLRILDLSFNKLITVSETAFFGLSKLEELNLRDCEIGHIPQNLLRSLKGLKKLNLRSNKLTSFDVSLVANKFGLDFLDLSHNPLQNLDKYAFQSFYLEELKINECRLQNVSEYLPPRTKSLDLSGSGINHISKDLFKRFRNLERINLDNNPVKLVDEDAFSNVINLEELSIRNCKLKNISNLLLAKNSKLKVLDLKSNELRGEDVRFLKYLPNLEHLNLAFNFLWSLDNDTFASNTKLKSLNLSFCLIGNPMAFLPPSLISVDLLGNQLNQTSRHIFANLSSLKHLNLDYNRRWSEMSDFFNLLNIQELGLLDNNIGVTQIAEIENQNLKILRLGSNELRQDPGEYHETTNEDDEMTNENVDTITSKLDHINLASLEVLILKDSSINELSKDSFSNLPNLKELSLHFYRLKSLESEIFKDLEKLERLTLDHSQIQTIAEDAFWVHPNMEELSFNFCNLWKLPENLPKNLRKLSLISNNLTNLERKIFRDLNKLEWLNFQNNPIKLIENDTFLDVVDLEYLSLQSCELKQLESGLFSKLELLKELNLDFNEIPYLRDDTFANNPLLEVLRVGYNKLSFIDVDFTAFVKIKKISLVFNQCTNEPKFSQNSKFSFDISDSSGLNISSFQQLVTNNCQIDQVPDDDDDDEQVPYDDDDNDDDDEIEQITYTTSTETFYTTSTQPFYRTPDSDGHGPG